MSITAEVSIIIHVKNCGLCGNSRTVIAQPVIAGECGTNIPCPECVTPIMEF